MTLKFQDDLFRLLEILFDEQNREWSSWQQKESSKTNEEQPVAIRTYKYILNWNWMPVNESKLRSLLKSTRMSNDSEIDFSKEKLVLFLPPFPDEQREFVPVAIFHYEPASECIGIRVGMYTLQDNGHPCGFAFRLEAPTSQCKDTQEESIHDFYHVQIVRNLGYGPDLGMPDWLPERQPAIYISANNPVEAILNLILSLYGLRYFKDFLKKHKSNLKINPSQIPSFSDFVRSSS